MDRHLLVDGGIVNNVPVDVVRATGADVIIAVNVGSGLTPEDELNSALAIVAQLSNLMIKYNTDQQLASLTSRDVLIAPRLRCWWMRFSCAHSRGTRSWAGGRRE